MLFLKFLEQKYRKSKLVFLKYILRGGINLDKLISFWLCLGLAMMIYKVSEWIISILARIPYDVRFILLSALLTLILYKNVQVTVNSESDEQEGR